MIENISPKEVVFSDFICTLVMSDEDLLAFICNTKLGESSDMAKFWVYIITQNFKLFLIEKCCGFR